MSCNDNKHRLEGGAAYGQRQQADSRVAFSLLVSAMQSAGIDRRLVMSPSGRYILDASHKGRVGAGSNGAVHAGWERATKRVVAVKICRNHGATPTRHSKPSRSEEAEESTSPLRAAVRALPTNFRPGPARSRRLSLAGTAGRPINAGNQLGTKLGTLH